MYNQAPNYKSIKEALNFVNIAILIDNDSRPEIKESLENFRDGNTRVFILRNNLNLGISRAYNLGVQYASSLGMYWIFLFDDDAKYDSSYFSSMFKWWQVCENEGVQPGILAPIVADSQESMGKILSNDYSIVKSVITSGIMSNIDIFEEVGGYNENYFVEMADFAFCERIRKHHFSIVRINQVMITQVFGMDLVDSVRNNLWLANLMSSIISKIKIKFGISNVLRKNIPVYGYERLGQFYKTYLDLHDDSIFKKELAIVYIIVNKFINRYISDEIHKM